MDIIEKYGNIIKNNMDTKPELSMNLIKLGLYFENLRVSKFPEKDIPDALKYLNKICVNDVRRPLRSPERSAWVNLFAPCEILNAMDISPLCMEAFSSFMSGFECEDFFIDKCEDKGIAETLCSYHKTFIGASEYRIFKKPKFQITTSTVCDANISTFRHVSNLYSNPHFEIDVPNTYSEENEKYVVSQLKAMVKFIEEIMNERLDEDKLKEIIKTENKSKEYLKKYIHSLKRKYYPSTLTLQMYMLFTSHISIGTEDTCNFYKMLASDIEKYPERTGLGIYWIHLIPFYHDVLKSYFNLNPDYQLLGYDLHFDYLEEMDYEHPFEALARKMINNIFNGPYERKLDAAMKIIEDTSADGVINFCQFGCKQSCGEIMLLKKALQKRNIPFLALEGDAIDRRNAHYGQVKTRIEAFFEILENKERRKIS